MELETWNIRKEVNKMKEITIIGVVLGLITIILYRNCLVTLVTLKEYRCGILFIVILSGIAMLILFGPIVYKGIKYLVNKFKGE